MHVRHGQQPTRSVLRIEALEARTEGDFETAFAIMAQRQAGALVVTPDPFFIARREQIIALANRYAVPAMYPLRITRHQTKSISLYVDV